MATNTNGAHGSTDANEETERNIRRLAIRRVGFILAYTIAIFLLMLAAIAGVLMGTNVWLSVIWLLPLIAFIIPFAYRLFRDVSYTGQYEGQNKFLVFISKFFVVVPAAILFIAIILMAFVIQTDRITAFLVGNEIYDTPGLTGIAGGFPWSILAWIFVIAITVALPVVLFVKLMQSMCRPIVSVREVLIYSVLTAASFSLPVGWSVIQNSGF